MKQNEQTEYAMVDIHHPFVGLNNKVCRNPMHWCAFHKVWLSEGDSRKRNCRCKKDGGERCHYFLEGQFDKGINCLLKRTRKTNRKGSKYYY